MSRIICTTKRPPTQGFLLSVSLSGKTINLLGCCSFWRENHWWKLLFRSSHVLAHYHAMIGQQLWLYMQN